MRKLVRRRWAATDGGWREKGSAVTNPRSTHSNREKKRDGEKGKQIASLRTEAADASLEKARPSGKRPLYIKTKAAV